MPGNKKRLTVLGLVGILVAALAVGVAAVALWPCSFPTPATGALDNSQSGMAKTTPSGFVDATDGVKLAYYASVPTDPVATLVFYHGSGANSTAGYLPLGQKLSTDFHIATYLVDIRGHGASGGPRGDAPTPGQVWDDTATMVDFVHRERPGLPEFVGGHSAGVGLVLNSISRIKDPVAGYVFLAPDFGLHSDTSKVDNASNFATVCQRPFIVNAISHGLLDGHMTALGFAYTASDIQGAGLVARYTVNMALAQNADDSAADLRAMNRPLGVWIGAQDEVFDPAKVIPYAKQAQRTTAEDVPGVNHLGILNTAAAQVGPWITAHR